MIYDLAVYDLHVARILIHIRFCCVFWMKLFVVYLIVQHGYVWSTMGVSELHCLNITAFQSLEERWGSRTRALVTSCHMPHICWPTVLVEFLFSSIFGIRWSVVWYLQVSIELLHVVCFDFVVFLVFCLSTLASWGSFSLLFCFHPPWQYFGLQIFFKNTAVQAMIRGWPQTCKSGFGCCAHKPTGCNLLQQTLFWHLPPIDPEPACHSLSCSPWGGATVICPSAGWRSSAQPSHLQSNCPSSRAVSTATATWCSKNTLCRTCNAHLRRFQTWRSFRVFGKGISEKEFWEVHALCSQIRSFLLPKQKKP